MLSIVDIKKELGKNIYLYPIHSNSIKGNSIDLHTSQFAWSLKTKDPLLSKDKTYLIIPPNDTALIYSEESIYVSEKIGGTLHSKVTLVCKGLSHVGTTLDPQYIGNFLVAIHNHSDNEYKLKVGAEFVSIVFHYLKSSDYIDGRTNNNDPGHPRMITEYNNSQKYFEWRDQNAWVTQEIALYNKMLDSNEYKQCKSDFEQEQRRFNRKIMHSKWKKYIVVAIILLAILGIFAIPSYFCDFGSVSSFLSTVTENVVLPLILAVLSAIIIVDFKN